MNGPLARHGQRYTFTRYGAPVMAGGELQARQPVLNNGQPWTMWASIQPIAGFAVMLLPEGLRNRAGVEVWGDTLLYPVDETKKLLGDRFTWNGYIYEVTTREDWTNTDLVHYHYRAFKLPNT